MNSLVNLPMRFYIPDWRIFLSALLIVLSFPPWGAVFFIWICLIPYFAVIRKAPDLKQAWIQGAWLGFSVSLGGFYWIAYVLHEFAAIPWILCGLALLVFASFCQLQLLLITPVIKLLEIRRAGPALLVSASLSFLYAGLDWVLPKMFTDTLGHVFYTSPILRQLADLTGPGGLTVIVFFFNHALWRFFEELKTRSEPSLWPLMGAHLPLLGTAGLLVLGALLYGKYRGEEISRLIANPSSTVQGAVIQGNIGDFDKIAAEQGILGAGEKIVKTYIELSERALQMKPKPDFLVWPETAYPSTFGSPNTSEELYRDQKVEKFARSQGTHLLFGGYDHVGPKDYNSFFLLSPRPKPGFPNELSFQVYHKSILLLFGEYIPGADYFTSIKKAFPQVGHFGRGPGPQLLHVFPTASSPDGVRMAPIICYEALFPNYVIGGARLGNQLIMNITNDSWFGPYGEPILHLALTVFRSIETRLPQLRATNTGISALIQADGELAAQTQIGVPKVMNVKIPITTPIPTLMKKWGDWFGLFSCVLGTIGILVALYFRPAQTFDISKH